MRFRPVGSGDEEPQVEATGHVLGCARHRSDLGAKEHLLDDSRRAISPSAHMRCWKHGTAPVIGLTGGVAERQELGGRSVRRSRVAVIDADSVGHAVLDLPAVQEQLVGRLDRVVGPRGPSGSGELPVDRRSSGVDRLCRPRSPASPGSDRAPPDAARFLEEIGRAQGPGFPSGRPVVLDAAILREAGWNDLCDLVVFVDAPRSERLRRGDREPRLVRAGFHSPRARRVALRGKQLRADFVISTDAPLPSLRLEVERFLATLAGPAPPEVAAAARALARRIAARWPPPQGWNGRRRLARSLPCFVNIS